MAGDNGLNCIGVSTSTGSTYGDFHLVSSDVSGCTPSVSQDSRKFACELNVVFLSASLSFHQVTNGTSGRPASREQYEIGII